MRATEIRYERVATVGRFETVRCAITIALDENETAAQGMAIARNFVETNLRLAGAMIVEDVTAQLEPLAVQVQAFETTSRSVELDG